MNALLNKIIGIKEASEITKLSPSTIKQYCINGIISSKKINHTWIIDKTKLVVWLEMKVIFETINNNFKANGEDGKYVNLYNNTDQLLENLTKESFEYLFNVKINTLKFPIITFSSDDHTINQLYESNESRRFILREAKIYFREETKNKVWEFIHFTVYEKSGVLKFENDEGEILGYISRDVNKRINELNDGVNPINVGWEYD